jgi:hypothetical protein
VAEGPTPEKVQEVVWEALRAYPDEIERAAEFDRLVEALPEDEGSEWVYEVWYPAYAKAVAESGETFPLPVEVEDGETSVETYGMFSLAGALRVQKVLDEVFAGYAAEGRKRLSGEDADWAALMVREQVPDEEAGDTEVREDVKAVARERVREWNRKRA